LPEFLPLIRGLDSSLMMANFSLLLPMPDSHQAIVQQLAEAAVEEMDYFDRGRCDELRGAEL
jgi:hypothetical protein